MLVSVYGIQFVYLVFGKPDRAELSDAQTESENNKECQSADSGLVESTNYSEAIDFQRARRIS